MPVFIFPQTKSQFPGMVAAVCLMIFSFGSSAFAQSGDGPTIEMWGVFQPRVSYGASDDSSASVNRIGYGIRRARLRVEVGLKNDIGVRYDSDFASGAFQTVDLFAFTKLTPRIRVRLGIMASAQPRAHIFTPVPQIDGFDRPAIAEQWGNSTLGGGGRDFGIDVQYETEAWTVVGFLHNGDGSFSKSRGNFSQTISSESATGDVEQNAFATSVYAAHRLPALAGVEIGGYLSYNPKKNANTEIENFGGRKYLSYSTHAYYGATPGSQPVRLKFDLIGINYEGAGDQKKLGMSLFGAVRMSEYAEFFGRYESVKKDTDLDADNYWSTGVTFSLSKLRGGSYQAQRATLGYSILDALDGRKEHLLVLQWQFML